MKILAIDTSTAACSAALNIDNQIVVHFKIAPQGHSELILEQCNELLAKAELIPNQLDAIAFGRGPGSFTGLRIAAGVTQGIAFATDLPVIGVSTLAAQAQKICLSHPDHLYFSAIDARMKEIYWGVYQLGDNQLVELQGDEAINRPSDIDYHKADTVIGVGSAWKEYPSDLEIALKSSKISHIYPEILPSAEEIALLAAYKLQHGDVLDAEKAIPVYLRNDVAKKAIKQPSP